MRSTPSVAPPSMRCAAVAERARPPRWRRRRCSGSIARAPRWRAADRGLSRGRPARAPRRRPRDRGGRAPSSRDRRTAARAAREPPPSRWGHGRRPRHRWEGSRRTSPTLALTVAPARMHPASGASAQRIARRRGATARPDTTDRRPAALAALRGGPHRIGAVGTAAGDRSWHPRRPRVTRHDGQRSRACTPHRRRHPNRLKHDSAVKVSATKRSHYEWLIRPR